MIENPPQDGLSTPKTTAVLKKARGMCEYRGCRSLWKELILLCGVIPITFCVRHWREYIKYMQYHPLHAIWLSAQSYVDAIQICPTTTEDALKAIRARDSAHTAVLDLTFEWLKDHDEEVEGSS